MAYHILSIGECMVELSQAGNGLLKKGFAGDTLNCAWYLRAGLSQGSTIDYLTCVGDDPLSDEMLAFIEKAGIGTSMIRRIPSRTPGLYLISLKDGERTFSYWRDTSAARQLAEDADHLRRAIDKADLVYFSGITLAILTASARETLLSELRRAKAAGKTIAYDPNIRPRLWEGKATMLDTISAGARAATMVLPSFDDETTHFGDANIAETIERYQALGALQVVVKNGGQGATVAEGSETIFVPAVPPETVVDTTSAGDSFNGGLLSRLIEGASLSQAAAHGAAVASVVISQHGALIDPALLPR
ncbi:sugar kinase [Rhizobium sp. SSA_523]|uniref:sugar kinase n=1 Tax=Rhizobium sp. SSA_523 TaxID=2952477 RepID=UPI0020908916|nr:sugar kinase [Rhizobium sp. SSA_523]MCO5730492.1 sugar kinase [Rhizobium sp. SSA_523]WKC25531.1 sugar kinase [Rhizobium sp. SSA_523]